MPVSPFAGKVVQPSMLVHVSKLIRAYDTAVADPSVPEHRGTFTPPGIVVPHSTRQSMNSIFSLSVRPFTCIANSRGSITPCRFYESIKQK